MRDLAMALVIIFCTPFGWIGLLVLGWSIAMICEAISGK